MTIDQASQTNLNYSPPSRRGRIAMTESILNAILTSILWQEKKKTQRLIPPGSTRLDKELKRNDREVSQKR